MKLNKLYIHKFRGASQPISIDFDSAKKITMYIPVKLTTPFRGKLTTKTAGERLPQVR